MEEQGLLNAVYDSTNRALRTTPSSGSSAYVPQARLTPTNAGDSPQSKIEPLTHWYKPTLTQNATSATANTWADLDATNLAITFVAPRSGIVEITLSANVQLGAGQIIYWGLRDATATIAEATHQVLQAPASVGVQTLRVTTVVRITKDGAAASLVPGTSYTVFWQHQCGVNTVAAFSEYGGNYGPASIKVTAVTSRITQREVTGTLTASPSGVPYWMNAARTKLIGVNPANSRIAIGTDSGDPTSPAVTWADSGYTTSFSGGINGVFGPFADGEILVYTGVSGSTNGAIFRSTGWATPASATFAQVLASTGGSSGDSYFSVSWGTSIFGEVICTNEYGPKAGPTDMARYSYMSTDGGKTWARIFDLYAQTSYATSAHLHGVAYDPWWDAIWITSGDYNGTGVLEGTFVSFDHGGSWTRVYSSHQFTSVIALPTCILLVSDGGTSHTDGGGNGIYRIPRISKDTFVIEQALILDTNSGVTIVGAQAFRSPSAPDAPTLLSILAGDVTGAGRLIATFDGYSFKTVWTDASTYTNHGLRFCVGPTVSGAYLGYRQSGSSDNELLTLTLA